MVADNQLGVTEQSEWLDHLRNLDLLPDPWNEMNWSGRGQHVEFLPHEAKEIPLKTEKVLGYTYSAIVESVRCKRIRLARKTIRCSRAFKREDAIREVEHLQKLHHSHIIRVVGSYILKKDLSILLYPVAEYTLNTFIEEMCEQPHFWPGSKSTEMRESLRQFFTCLLHAVSYLHKQAIKHMDIKPKNLLIRDVRNSRYRGVTNYKVYLADFGIARSYRSEAEAETSGPTSFTRIYSAPEVVAQDTRGLKADIFSLGAVFTEMLAVTWQPYPVQQRQHLIDIRGCNSDYDKSFQANILPIQDWLSSLSTPRMSEPERTIASIAIKMLHYEPSSRPQADALLKMRCFSNSGTCCIERTEEFEIAKDTL
ncbi:kinase-like protein [Patellaria atrata CBS 101060]|uniref:Kinase-like protein n=1 Tax=Patellaria atrata CBS 101060 TaxID=1346257 RepID=A0A9P4SDI0_9PEZI|nr:kinase-like protein [Patellaria atrata CBS 101060]